MNQRRQGFTLIELLIVITILGVLAAVLIPNLGAARNRAVNGSAQAFVRAVVTGVEIQRDDVHGTLPAAPPSCADAAGKAGLPASVKTCAVAYRTANTDSFVVNVSSSAGSTYTYDGENIRTGTTTP